MAFQKPLIPAAAIVALAMVAYLGPLAQAGFVWDDDMYVVNNPTLRTLGGLRDIWLEPRSLPQYYPLVHTTFWVEYRLWGLDPRGYHLVNLLLHTGSALFLWTLLRRLAVPGAWLAAAVFAVHPVHVESVAWITERKNVLSTVLYLASALSLLSFFGIGERPRSWGRYALGCALFLGALWSKTVTASLPAALLLVLWWKKPRLGVRDVLPLLPLFVLGAGFGLTTAWLEKHHVGAQGDAWDLGFVERCLIAGRALWFYAAKLVWPHNLTFIYPRWTIDARQALPYFFPAGAAAVLLALWLRRDRLGKGPLVGALFFAGTLVPALGFFNVFPMRYSFVADHFQYLASVGVIATLAAAVAELFRGRPLAGRAAAALVLALLAFLTSRQARVYRDLETLWRDTLAKNPRAWMAHTNLGMILVRRGDVEEGIAHYRTSIEIEPTLLEPRLNLGEVLQRQGRYEEAIPIIAEAVRLHPENPFARYNLGTALAKRGQYAEAVTQLREAVARRPGLVEAQFNLGTALLNLGRLDEASAHFQAALRARPDHAGAHLNLARVLELQGDAARARTERVAGLRLRAFALASQEDPGARNGPEAVRLAEQAVSLAGPGDALALDALAAAFAETGRFDDAVRAAREAVEAARGRGSTALARSIEARLALYRSRRPYREPARLPRPGEFAPATP